MSDVLLNLPAEVSEKARTTARRYLGSAADEYEQARSRKKKWEHEDKGVRWALRDLPPGTSILDIPCGTGRFFEYYKVKQFIVCGLDISPGMVAHAKARADDRFVKLIREGDIFDINFDDGTFDVSVSVLMMNLIEESDLRLAFAELMRVTRKRIVFSLRTHRKNPERQYHKPHSLETIEKVLTGGWRIDKADPIGGDDTYRMVTLCNG